MNKLTKMVSVAVAALILLPLPGQASKASSANRGQKPVISMGDRPGAVTVQNAKQNRNTEDKKASGNKITVKTGTKTQQTAAPKRNLNAIYILPKGYKDITIKGKAEATKKQAAQLIAVNNTYLPIGCSVGEIVDLYWEEAGREGIRPDMALSQAVEFFQRGDTDLFGENAQCLRISRFPHFNNLILPGSADRARRRHLSALFHPVVINYT